MTLGTVWTDCWTDCWIDCWAGGVVPPAPVSEWQPVQGSQGGSTMLLPRLPGRFGEDHGRAVPDHVRAPQSVPEPLIPIEARAPVDADELFRKELRRQEFIAERLAAREAAAQRVSDKLAQQEADQLERLRIEAENDELAMLAVAIAVAL